MWIDLILRMLLLVGQTTLLMIVEKVRLPITIFPWVILFTCQYLLTVLMRDEAIENSATNSRRSALALALYAGEMVVACLINSSFYYFWPLFAFELVWSQESKHRLEKYYLLLIEVVAYLCEVSLGLQLLIGIQSILTCLCHSYLVAYYQTQGTFYKTLDELNYQQDDLRSQLFRTISRQNRESEERVQVERRRIMGEIHDSIGHQLSSAIIQLGALSYLVEEPSLKDQLSQTSQRLDQAMINVRQIIHQERQMTVDLEREFQQLVNDFNKVSISFSYQNQSQLNQTAAHSLVRIVQEGLANINKHSDASQVQLTFREFDREWTLLLADNGHVRSKPNSSRGIGLLNMEERVEQMGGILHLSQTNGFRIYIRIPKKGNCYEDSISR